jgi:hypothetical protein
MPQRYATLLKTLGHFRFMYEIRNMNNLSNHLMLDIVGHAVKDRVS